jgi:hypothetical protein
LIFWLPSFFSRSYGLTLTEVSWFYGSIVLIGALPALTSAAGLATASARTARPAMPSFQLSVS